MARRIMLLAIPLLTMATALALDAPPPTTQPATRPAATQPTTQPVAVMVLLPYWSDADGTWVFDDPAAGLKREPFVRGIPALIDDLVKDIPNARRGFRLLFFAAPFPGYTQRFTWVRAERGGNWYATTQPTREGWLCPALFRYFKQAPAALYVKAEGLER